MKTPWWFLHKTPLAFLLLPVAWIYYFVGRIVYFFRRFGALKSRRKIVCVGNILAGGVGKTPVVRAIANFMDAPVVMRGYKKTKDTGDVGDEATMLSQDGLQVHVGDRKSNIILLNKQDSDVPIVMDDGFQNSSIKKDVVVLVFDEGLGCGNGFLLPAGPLREPKRAIKRADAIVVIKNKKPKKSFKLKTDLPIFYAKNQTVSPYSENERIVAFSGIGYPKKFFRCLKNVVATRSFADHYQFTDEDIEKLYALAKKKKAKLVTTEKDWVRLSKDAQEKIKYANLETTIDDDFWGWIKGKLNVNN